MICPSCGTGIEPRTGPGRPATYCSETCRRLAEFQIRGLVRRLDKAELELREIKAGGWIGDEDERRQRMRVLRRWIRDDTATLRRLLGARDQVAPQETAGADRGAEAKAK